MSDPLDGLFEALQELTSLCGVSGREHAVVKFLKKSFTPLADEVFVDSHGNLAAMREGGLPGPTYMITAHSDEVGAVVTTVTEDGFLMFHPVGVIDCRIFPGTRLLVDQRIVGTVVCIPGHTSKHADYTQQSTENLLLDIGAASATQVAEWGIESGMGINYISPLTRMTQKIWSLAKQLIIGLAA